MFLCLHDRIVTRVICSPRIDSFILLFQGIKLRIIEVHLGYMEVVVGCCVFRSSRLGGLEALRGLLDVPSSFLAFLRCLVLITTIS